MTYQPLIGVSLDTGRHQKPGMYSKYPWYAIRRNYLDSIVQAGGIPILLPFHPELVSSYADKLDGLLIPGGDLDVPPSYYGETVVHEKVSFNLERTEFEFALTEAIKDQGKPVLGICGGMQLLNVVFGGSLFQHIPDAIPTSLAHEQPNPRCEAGHTVAIQPNTILSTIAVSQENVPVNSAHHQAVKDVAPYFQVNAVAEDGVIEGIEYTGEDNSFIMGIQWHPEFHISPLDTALFQHFINCAKKRKK